MPCRSNRSSLWSCQTSPSCRPSSKTAAANRTASSPRRRLCRHSSRPPMAARHRLITAGSVTSRSNQEDAWPKERAQTLSELKKQRSAAKLLNHPLFNGHLGNGSTDSFSDAKNNSEDPRMPLVSSNGSAVYYTPASGDPPLLKLKQPMEEEPPKAQTCCCVS